MTNRKQTIASLAIVGMALFATVMTTMMSLPTQALALGHWNLDEDFAPNIGFAEDSVDSSGTTDSTNDNGEDSTTAAAMDEDEEGGSEEDTGSNDKKDSSQLAYDDMQVCLSDAEGEGSPTEQEVQDCIETSYGEIESGEKDPTESTDDRNEDKNDMTEGLSSDDTKDEEDEQSEDQS